MAGSFHLYDSDHDGYITREEVEAIVDSMHKMVGQMVELSEDDETPQKRVDKIFETMDLVSCYHQAYPVDIICYNMYSKIHKCCN